MRTRLPRRGQARILGLLTLVFLFVAADSVLQTVLPVSMTETGAASVAVIGIMIAIPQGIGFITALPGTAFGDAHGRARVVALHATIAAMAAGLLAVAASGRSMLWWIAPLLLFGLVRLTVWISILATVSTTGDRLTMQGLNGASQRLAAAAAALISAAVIASQGWEGAYLVICAAFVLMVPLALAVLPRTATRSGPLVTPRASYSVAVSIVRSDRAIRASGLAAMCCMTVMLVGNSFFALTMTVDTGDLAALVAILLVTRDLSSVVIGLTFKQVVNKVGLSGTVTIAVGCAATSMLILAVSGSIIVGVVAAAVLQGTSICLLIGSTNLLAVYSSGVPTAGAALRITASQIGPSIGALIMPIVLAGALGFGGTALLYTLATVTIIVLGAIALLQMRPPRTAPTATTPNDITKDGDHHEPHHRTDPTLTPHPGMPRSPHRTDPVGDLPALHPRERDLGPAPRA